MGKALVIVESPAKAKTINKYLGNDYIVKSSIGHIRDLPTSSSASKKNNNLYIDRAQRQANKDKNIMLVNRMGVDPFHDWKAHYEILPGKEKIVDELRLLAKKSKHIYLATDLDREGEAIAWHLREVIGGEKARFSRIVFNEITKKAIQQAFSRPIELNINRVNAQQARRFMDRIVGFMVSPLLWKKIARGLSAGRVQSVAMRLVVERERKIKAFMPQEYWQLHANLLTENGSILQEVTHANNYPFKPVNYQEIHSAVEQLKKARYKVLYCKNKLTSRKPTAPFITSTLQQAASISLKFLVQKTMIMAQRLYEAGYITYMRTDSTSISQDALIMVRNYIINNFGNKYLPEVPNKYSGKEHVQEAHEAIRPSDINTLPNHLKDMEVDAQNLYHLIWRQFVASQMTAAQYDSTMLLVEASEYRLRTTCRKLRFDGWTKLMPELDQHKKDIVLPFISVGSELRLQKLIPSQHFSKPPQRYSEASLVKKLEKCGIGRPSTYASVISTIQDRGYVRMDNHRLYAEKLGEIVTDRLVENFCGLMNYNFTAHMEDWLDQVANNKANWKALLDKFFTDFNEQLKKAEQFPELGGMRTNQMVMTNINCPICNCKMGIRTASTGVFLGCSGYELPKKERCKATINLLPEAEVINILEGDEAETNALRARSRCYKCGTAMDTYIISDQRNLLVCGNNPSCDGYEIKNRTFRLKGYNDSVIACDKCTYKMHLKIGRFGKYMGCSNEKCKNTRKFLRNGDLAPPKEDPIAFPELACEKSNAYFVLRHGAAGVFLAANTFPKSRETRAPLVEELVRFKDRLSEKLRYLADAPIVDNAGNKTLVRFSRKTKQQYVTSENKAKDNSWSVFYINGKWIERRQ